MSAVFSYRPGVPAYGKTFSRASVAYEVQNASDAVFVWWPSHLHLTATFARTSVAYYVNETGYPEPG